MPPQNSNVRPKSTADSTNPAHTYPGVTSGELENPLEYRGSPCVQSDGFRWTFDPGGLGDSCSLVLIALDLDLRLVAKRKGHDERRPLAGRALDADPSVQGFDAILQSNQARASSWIRAADAVILNRELERPVLLDDVDAHDRRARMPGHVRERFRDNVVRSHLDAFRHTKIDSCVQLHRHGRTTGERFQRGAEPSVREDRWMDAAGDLSQVVDRGPQPAGDPRDLRLELAIGREGGAPTGSRRSRSPSRRAP
jgi:hypothetical protein